MLKWFVCTRELITAAILTMFAFAFQTGSMKHTHTHKNKHIIFVANVNSSAMKRKLTTVYVVKTEKIQPVYLT